MDKLNAYHSLSIEDANMVDRYMIGTKTADQQDRLANLVLESRAQAPSPAFPTIPQGSMAVSADHAVRIDSVTSHRLDL